MSRLISRVMNRARQLARSIAHVAWLGLAGSAALGCPGPRSTEAAATHVELGVFYGGQIQQLRSVPWPADAKRPTLGFRLSLPEPLSHELLVRWEVDMPSRGAPGGRVQRVSEARLESGQVRLDQPIEIPPGAELGLWNVRVVAEDRLVLDRAVRLFDPVR